eukprot:CAMPEP_0181169302 /NCGR_PEP_ID=MMETSP1096-20121128/742_1 /TAXON_ID=156174 ORGANISM="Chrysochromulina ericina, Strain CCMP281" /NCGR_SAMPLE_ID=MMETSP1096 /ASSEMBLY_ACC=CAM_ASM_000453 /LENGTH=142 /DNA_ID=CAMNT_0023256751 /DNA_START=78 /DNA_END=505 /DNA_ORIENTATION=-
MDKIEYKRLKYEYQGRTIYEWEQSLEDVHMYIAPPPGVTAKMLDCKITASRLTLGLKGNPPFIDVSVYTSPSNTRGAFYMSSFRRAHICRGTLPHMPTMMCDLRDCFVLSQEPFQETVNASESYWMIGVHAFHLHAPVSALL